MLKSALLDEADQVMRRQGKARSTRKTYRIHLESLLKWARWKHGEWKHPRDIGKHGVSSGSVPVLTKLFCVVNLRLRLRGLASRKISDLKVNHAGAAYAAPGLTDPVRHPA